MKLLRKDSPVIVWRRMASSTRRDAELRRRLTAPSTLSFIVDGHQLQSMLNRLSQLNGLTNKRAPHLKLKWPPISVKPIKLTNKRRGAKFEIKMWLFQWSNFKFNSGSSFNQNLSWLISMVQLSTLKWSNFKFNSNGLISISISVKPIKLTNKRKGSQFEMKMWRL